MAGLPRWLRNWAILGLAVAASWLLIAPVLKPSDATYAYATFVPYVFPGAFFLMVLELGERTPWDRGLVISLALLSNALLYAAAGLFLWMLGRLARRMPLLALILALAGGPASPQVGAAIEGRVFSLSGEPLEGVAVEARSSTRTATAATASDGSFHLDALAEGTWSLTLRLSGFLERTETYDVKPGKVLRVDLGLTVGQFGDPASCNVDVVVNDGSGRHLDGASVVAVAALDWALRRESRTDARGHVALTLPNGGLYVVYAFKPGFELATRGLSCRLPAVVEVRLILPRLVRTP